jgi:hypothetical protein
MNQKRQIKLDREIIASVKKEMDKPRMAESVRRALEADAALAARVPLPSPASA